MHLLQDCTTLIQQAPTQLDPDRKRKEQAHRCRQMQLVKILAVLVPDET